MNRGKEATVLGTGGRLRRLAAMVGGEYARDDSEIVVVRCEEKREEVH